MAEVDSLQIKISADATKATKALENLASAFEHLGGVVKKNLGLSDAAKEINEFADSVKDSVGRINELANALKTIKGAGFGSNVKDAAKGVADAAKDINTPQQTGGVGSTGTGVVDGGAKEEIVSNIAAVTKLAQAYSLLNSKAARSVSASKELASVLASLKGQTSYTKTDMNRIAEAMAHLRLEISKAQRPTQRMSTLLGRLGKKIAGIIFYRGIRAALSGLRNAIGEGIKNLYEYSRAMNNMDASHASGTLDSFATNALYVKNALATALIPILYSIVPIVDRIASAFVQAANAVAAFFSALNGSATFTGAVKASKKFENNIGGAAGKAEELKKTLLGFDEINRLEAPNDGGGGGGGGNALDASDMFDEFEVPEKIKKFVEWLKDHLELIKGLAFAIGAALLAWRIGSTFMQALKLAPNLLGGILTALGLVALALGAIDAWVNGLDWTNLLTMLGGIALIVGGLAIVLGATGAAIGMLIGGIVLLVVALHEWITTGELSTETFVALAAGILLVGGAIALLTGSWIPLVVAAVAVVGLTIYKYWDKIKGWLSDAWAKVKEVFTNIANKVKETVANIWDKISNVINKVTEKVSTFRSNIKQRFDDIRDKITGVADSIRSAWESLVGWFHSIHIPTFHWDGWTSTVISILGRNFTISLPNIGFYANGGFPEDGLFMANHGELVGQFSNGRTAVANNEQIIEGIKAGVYDAVLSAMNNSNGNGQRIELFVDGRKMTDVVTKYQRQNARAYS